MANVLLGRRHPRGSHGPAVVVVEGICALVVLCALVAALSGGLVLMAVRLMGPFLGDLGG